MIETTGAQPPTVAKKNNLWLIVIVVCVVLCCFCVGAIGLLFAFGEPILNELNLYTLLPVLNLFP
jgi:hypothetical protein